MENERPCLLSMSMEELQSLLADLSQPSFRAKQLFAFLQKGTAPEAMSSLPKALRDTLFQRYSAYPAEILQTRCSSVDDTVKFLFGFADGNCVEGVLMHYHYGYSLCISTQVGCKMGCAFCASTLNGCVRNLTRWEMLGEVLCANRFLQDKGETVGHIVLMGSGEPLDNYDEAMAFLQLVNDPARLNISLRNISLSTCGLVPKMYDLADAHLPVTLSVSLHAPNDAVRKTMMPVANVYPMDELLKACRYYIEKTGRRVIFEYALVSGVNASPQQAVELAGRLRGMQCHVNLIPLNEVKERGLSGVNEKQVQDFLHTLEDCHISATRRREMGDDIEGACGQLRRKVLSEGGTL